ncbi:sce7725 family protein [Lacticaseibacillus daqingensis]|uniref:sce7725 family protein n=1 Tax=Lacticaseibacillus daqingensis TaxID=2486014 RepID=UPI000F77DC1E|nr:sce7725 family protein [Lacticaseibacillus daqingensis]
MNYYPLIRGRQYDLLALTQLVKQLAPTIIPVIEPVKDTPSLARCVAAFSKAHHPLFVIQNPAVGQYGLLAAPQATITYDDWVQPARWFDPQPAPLQLVQTVAQLRQLPPTQRVIVPAAARFRRVAHPQAIYLTDHLPTRARTEDYASVQTEFYQYPLALQPGVGLADYPLSTRQYSEHGYPQRAIALHLLFADRGALFIRHFTSVNNADFAEPQAKFFEALTPLAPWLAEHPQAATPATTTLLDLLATRHFPGLGTVRKLQLQHWLTIMGRWLA